MAVFYQRLERLDVVLGAAQWSLFALTAGSLAAMAWSPTFVLHRPEAGIIPGIDWRLYGLTEHANTIGPVALVAVILESYRPAKRRVVRLSRWIAAGSVLVLAQSRTAWAAALLIGLLVAVPLAMQPGHAPAERPIAFRRASWTLLACIVTTIALVVAFAGYGVGEALQRKAELSTLNGRFLIWDITLRAWRDNPLFGYGAEIWGVERQFRFAMFHVGHAHNQLVQTLGESGLAGLALLVFYLGVLIRAAVQRFAQTQGLLLALLIVLLARCVTEAPMRAEGLLSWSTFLHVLILVVACHSLREPRLLEVQAGATLAHRHRRATSALTS